MVIMGFPIDISKHVEVLDPSISHYLRQEEIDKESLEHWLGRIDFAELDLLLLPYNEKYQSSFFLFKFFSIWYLSDLIKFLQRTLEPYLYRYDQFRDTLSQLPSICSWIM